MTKRNTREKVLRDIVKFHNKSGLSFTVIGSRAIADPRLYDRLHKGGTMTIEKMDRLYEFFNHYTKEQKNDRA